MGINRTQKIIIISLIASYIIWSSLFIYHSSFIGIDGERYYSLFDDAMISMRYAWNFANNNGLVWNPGERVQGYTNLLMTLIMSLANLIFEKKYAVLSIQVIGLLFVISIALVTAKASEEFFPKKEGDKELRNFLKIIVIFCVLSYFPLSYWSLLGMETGLLTLLLLLGVYYCLKYLSYRENSYLVLMSVYLSLAFLTRIDSIIYAAIIYAILILRGLFAKNVRFDLTKLIVSGIFYGLIVFGLLYFQKTYYGNWLPNTYALKITGLPLMNRLRNGVIFIKPFLADHIVFLVLPLIGLFINFQWKRLLLFLLVITSIIYQIFVGGEIWLFWRMMAPIVPLAILLSSLTLVDAGMRVVRNRNSEARKLNFVQGRHKIEKIVLLFMIAGIFSANLRFLPGILFREKLFEVTFNERNVNIALILSEITSPEATVGVLPAGSIPYYTGRLGIDFLGKCDEFIAQLPPDLSGSVSWKGMDSLPGHNKYDLNYSIKLFRPTYVYTLRYGIQDLSEWGKEYYIPLSYQGTRFYLLKDSTKVLWDKIESIEGLEIIAK